MGIEFQTSTRYTLQANGFVERFNGKILKKSRSLLIQAKMPLSYWIEAIIHVAIL